MSQIIGFCGYARSGKDTAAKALIERGWKRVAFADALKADVACAMQRSLCKIADGGVLSETLIEDHKEAFRPLLVEYGRAMRRVRASYWIDRAMTEIRALSDGIYGDNVVITDVRYQNEVNAIHAAGGKVIQIFRHGIAAANDEESNSFAHVYPDAIIWNDGAIEELHAKVLCACGLTNPAMAM